MNTLTTKQPILRGAILTAALVFSVAANAHVVFAADPTASLSATPASVVAGSPTTLTWSSTNATSCTGSGFSTGGATSGSVSVSPTVTKTYTVTCSATTPYTWQKTSTDVTDLWCSANPTFSNYYTNNECPGNTPPSGACTAVSDTCFVNDWQTKFEGAGGNDTQSCNLITETYTCASGGGSATAQASKSVTVTVTPPVTPPPAGPTCTLDLTKDNISWTTTGANTVTIVPLTNSPAVPGQSATIPAGTSVFSGTWGSLKSGKTTELQNELRANGVPGATVNSDHGFYANKTTANRICSVLFPGTVNGTYQSRAYTSPGDNTVFIWSGAAWSQLPAEGHNSHFRGDAAFTCVTAAPSGGTLALSGLHNFIPPLGFGTHTYKLTATGPNGSKMCQKTITVLPPAPTVELTAEPSTISRPGSSTLSWDSTNATSCVGTNFSTGGAVLGSVVVSPSATQTYSISCTGAGGSATDTATVTVTPPATEPFCDLFGTSLPIGAGNPTTIYYASTGATSFTVNHGVGALDPVTDGIFSVSPTATTTYTGTASGPGGTAYCSWTINVVPPPPPPPPPPPTDITLYAGKVICEDESLLPNWSGGVDITPSLVYDFLDEHEGECYLATGWGFEYADGDTGNPGDNTIGATGGDWTLFSDTGNNGYATVSFPLASLANKTKIWLREVNQSGYVPFSGGIGPLGSNVSAEFYCGNDVLNYDNYEQIVNPTGGSTYYCVAFNAPVETPPGNPPTVDLVADPHVIDSGESSTLSWTSTNATSCASTDFATGGATSGSVVVSPNHTEQYSISCAGPGGTAEDQVTVAVNAPSPACTLNASSTSINPGESVTLSWESEFATSGSINGNIGAVSPASHGSIDVFPSDDITYTGTFTGPHGTDTCSVFVDVRTGGGGGGGGGGYNQPTTVLLSQPFDAPLVAGAFVSLEEIPYTGFEAGFALTMIFWTAVALFAALVSYYLVGKSSVQSLLAYVTSVAGVPTEEEIAEAERMRERERMYGPEYPSLNNDNRTDDSASYMASSAIVMPAAMARPVPTAPASADPSPVLPHDAPATDGIPALSDVMESRAHAAGVLVSPEALALALALSSDRQETLRIFGDILNRAVQTVPREDGWVMLTTDRFNVLNDEVRRPRAIAKPAVEKAQSMTVTAVNDDTLAEVPPAHTYTLGSTAARTHEKRRSTTLDEAATSTFAGAVLSGDRDTAFGIIRSLEASELSPVSLMTGTAAALDRIYRLRKGGRNGVDPALLEKSEHADDDTLHEVVSVFAHSLDSAYANPFTGVKLALAQAFEILR